MNLIFDLDDTLYDLMGPFELVHKKLYADKTDADCTELFIKSRDYSDEIMEAEIKGDIPHEDCFYERIKRTYHDVGIEMNRDYTELIRKKYLLAREWKSSLIIVKLIIFSLPFLRTGDRNLSMRR